MFHQQLTTSDVCSDALIYPLPYQGACWYGIASASLAKSLLLPAFTNTS